MPRLDLCLDRNPSLGLSVKVSAQQCSGFKVLTPRYTTRLPAIPRSATATRMVRQAPCACRWGRLPPSASAVLCRWTTHSSFNITQDPWDWSLALGSEPRTKPWLTFTNHSILEPCGPKIDLPVSPGLGRFRWTAVDANPLMVTYPDKSVQAPNPHSRGEPFPSLGLAPATVLRLFDQSNRPLD